MRFYDTHMHSRLSFDSFEDPANYLDEKTEVITFTDHLDLDNTANSGRNDIPDFDEVFQWRDDFKTQKQVDVLLGVEIGYVPSQQARLEEILAPYDFDVKLLSVHQNDQYDYMDEVDVPADEMIRNYLEQLLLAVKNMPSCNIMTHFDYGFRIHDIDVADLTPYIPLLTEIFEQCIAKDLAFELNSKSLIAYEKLTLYEWAVPFYIELGGSIFSIGSDAHKAEEHFMGYEQAIALLEQFDVTEIAQFYQGERTMVALDDVKEYLGIEG